MLSGINRGANVGTWWHMSGTVGGAMMGALYGIVLSISIPRATESPNAGVTVAPMGGSDLTSAHEAVAAEGGERRVRPRIGVATEGPPGSDTEAFLKDMTAILPIRFDWTATSVVNDLKTWGLTKAVRR